MRPLSAAIEMRHLRLGVLMVIVVLAATGGAGCSRAQPPPTSPSTPTAGSTLAFAGESSEQIMQRALDAYRAAHTVHVRGQRIDDNLPTLIDLSIDLDQAAYLEILRPNGHTVEIRRLADKIYIKADPAYWKQTVANQPDAWNAPPDQIATHLQGKYLVAVPQTSASGADIIPQMLNQEVVYPNQAFGAFLDGPTTRGDRTTFNGTPVVTILNLNPDSRATLNADTLYLTATATPLPLRIEGPRGFLDFQDFGAPVTVTAPPTSQIVDIATLRATPH